MCAMYASMHARCGAGAAQRAPRRVHSFVHLGDMRAGGMVRGCTEAEGVAGGAEDAGAGVTRAVTGGAGLVCLGAFDFLGALVVAAGALVVAPGTFSSPIALLSRVTATMAFPGWQ